MEQSTLGLHDIEQSEQMPFQNINTRYTKIL